MLFTLGLAAFSTTFFISSAVQAIELNVSDADSIKNAAATIAFDMMSYYTGNKTNNSGNVGLLPSPYYWWEAGAMWGSMVDYWYYTKDESYTSVVSQAILSQASPTNDFMMPNQHFDLIGVNNSNSGNDDQVFWGLTAMSAAEYSYPNPSKPSWIELATNVFNDMTTRWNTTVCNGGLKWQIFPENSGYNYRSSIANGGFFQLSARLARYTGNVTYVEWAEKSWNWMTAIGLISDGYNVFDGTDDTINCSAVDHTQWTYNNAVFIYGSAMLANISDESSPWASRTRGFLSAAESLFFSPFPNATNVMFEAQCEKTFSCNTDQYSFKAYLSRWLYATAKVLPELEPDILALMRPSAEAAANSCSGGAKGRTCGTEWWRSDGGGAVGLGQQMSALEVVHGLLLDTVDPPSVMTNRTGSTREHVKKHVLRAKERVIGE